MRYNGIVIGQSLMIKQDVATDVGNCVALLNVFSPLLGSIQFDVGQNVETLSGREDHCDLSENYLHATDRFIVSYQLAG